MSRGPAPRAWRLRARRAPAKAAAAPRLADGCAGRLSTPPGGAGEFGLGTWGRLGSMVAHDEVGGLLPIKRTIRVLDVNNQSFREQEVRLEENSPEVNATKLTLLNSVLTV